MSKATYICFHSGVREPSDSLDEATLSLYNFEVSNLEVLKLLLSNLYGCYSRLLLEIPKFLHLCGNFLLLYFCDLYHFALEQCMLFPDSSI